MDAARARFRAVLCGILAIGLGAAALIWSFAAEPEADPLGASKMYVHDMVLYGGKTNMVLAELAQWIESLWHGRRLAGTIAVATLLAAGAFWYFFAPVEREAGGDAARD